MRYVASVEEVRAAEAGLPEAVLIDRASTAVARRAAAMLGRTYGARVLVVAGPGHNGADALWAGWKLRQRGASVSYALPLGEPRDEHGAEPLRRLKAAGARQFWGSYDLAIDGVLGVGGRSATWPAPWSGFMDSARVLAVDVPTGVDAATGAVSAAVRAEVTVTFGALKPGLVVGPGAAWAGIVEVAPIGLGLPDLMPSGEAPQGGTWVLGADDASAAMGPPWAETDKYRRGVVGVAAGSAAYPGAAALACRGAQRSGCGYVRLRSDSAVADSVRAAYPEVVAGEGRVDAWVVGPGLGTDDAALAVLREVLASDVPVVVDADGLTLLAKHPDLLRRNAPTVLTPHTGEFERLTGVPRADAEADRLGVTRKAAADLGAVVLLKGTTTVVAAPDGTAYVNPTGTPWLGTAGTGDVLAGAIAAVLSRPQEDDVAYPVAAAVWLHGLAGRLAAGSPGAAVTALDVAERLPDAARIALGAC
ncbi:MAG TPA: NAD(P)H-hydrate dehydratase [Frankiaceae bacterium]|nr:NAD(P)H-hydrate dehydratase [Frankiaceae bacterium]